MDYKAIGENIKKGLAEKLGDDVTDLSVSLGVHDPPYEHGSEFGKIVVRVYASEITVIKPASKKDMLKLAMPRWIQRIFPPKTVEVKHFIALPAIREARKQKVAALVYYTDEIKEHPDLFYEWFVESGSKSLKSTYMNKTFRGW